MKRKFAITSALVVPRKQALYVIELGAVTAAYSADHIEVLKSTGTPEAIPASCGLAELWGITSNHG